ncbi:glycoside hydrolase [Neoconidiobolus thromboides FSU 785]|nr:glycoside hydrolase [Neoconidiobolus thromboides FSU 785]
MLFRSYYLNLLIITLSQVIVTANKIGGFTYSPYLPYGCKDKQQIKEELSKIIKLTSNLRLYSTDCDQLKSVVEVISENQFPLSITAGIWMRSGEDRYKADVDTVVNVLKQTKYAKLIKAVTVGNEELKNGGNAGSIVAKINQVKGRFASEGVNVPIGSCEIGADFLKNPELAKNSQVIFANLYSFFSQVKDNNMMNAAQSVIDQYTELTKSFGNKVVISETGWPSYGSGNYRAAADIPNQGLFTKYFTCKANQMNIPYYILEPFDSKWKSKGDSNSIEPHFGLLNPDGSFKSSTLNSNSC